MPGELWHDTEGLWYSSKFLARRAEQEGGACRSIEAVHVYFRKPGVLTRFKSVPTGNKRGGSPPTVHHASEVEPLLGMRVSTTTTSKPELQPVSPTDATDPTPSDGKRIGGRPRDSKTELVYRACYDAYIGPKKLSTALVDVQRMFEHGAPKDESSLRRYAKRYAERYNLPVVRSR